MAPLLVLVTGASGFIGSHLVEALLAEGYRVRCMVRRTSSLEFIHSLPVEFVHAELRTVEGLRTACEGVDAVCHCAALTRARDRETFMQANAVGTAALAQACAEVSPRLERFIFLSSHAAAGPSRGPDDYLDETRTPSPVTWYGESKLAAERMLVTASPALPVVILRCAPVHGPRDRDFRAYYTMVEKGLAVTVAPATRRFSAIFVRDLVRLILLALENDSAVGRTYFATSDATTYIEFSAAVALALGRRPRHITLPEAVLGPMALWAKLHGHLASRPPLMNEQRVADLRHRYWLCSGEKARRELGFAPRYELGPAVTETAKWYREAGWL